MKYFTSFKHLNLRAKYIMTYILTIVLPIGIIFWMLISFITQTIQKQTLEKTLEANLQMKSNISYALGHYLDIINQLSFGSDLQSILNRDVETINRDVMSYTRRKDAILNSILFSNYQIVPRIYLLENTPIIDHNFILPIEENSLQQEKMIDLMNLRKAQWVYESGKIVISRAMTTLNDLRPLGLVEIDIRERELYYQLQHYNVEEWHVIIFDESGIVVSSNERLLVGENVLDSELFSRKFESDIIYTADGRSAILYERLDTEPNYPKWTIATIVPLDSIHDLSRHVAFYGCLVLILCFIIASLVYFLLTGSVVRRIKLLINHMENLGQGHFNVIPLNTSKDEIDAVAQTYNDMLEQLKKLIDDQYISNLQLKTITIEKQNAEMYALQNQIHPHFLFNTLESIRMKMKNNDNHRAEDMIVSLSRILRMSLSSSEDLIPLENELEYVKYFIQIQNARFPGKIIFQIDVPEKLYPFRIPKYSIQTMIENAIEHGFDSVGRNGKILVKACKCGDEVIIKIQDNGKGICEEELNSLREEIKRPMDKIETEKIGIKNVYNRLIIHFGEECRINLEGKENEGFSVEIILSVKEDKKDV